MVWKDAGAIFQRRCHGRRRCLIVRSVLISPKWRDCSQAIPIVNFLRSFFPSNSVFSAVVRVSTKYQPYWWLIINARDQFCWTKVNCKWFIEDLYKLNLFYFRRNNGIVQLKKRATVLHMLRSPANLAREQNARKRHNLCEIIGSRRGEQNKHHCFCISNTSKVSAILCWTCFVGEETKNKKLF